MKSCLKNYCFLRLLPTFSFLLSIQVTAQTFTVLHDFDGSGGGGPVAALTISSNTIYGTTFGGGASNLGTVFKINTDGTGFTNLHSFNGNINLPFNANTDGAYPQGGLLLVGNTLYGTTAFGGTNGNGTVFALRVDGTDFTNLHLFNGTDGAEPYGGRLVVGNSTLYGTTSGGGVSNGGTVFTLSTDGTGFTSLHNFNSGEYPFSGLLLSSNILYGTTSVGANGTVFALHTDGSGFTNLHKFNGSSDGAHPQCDLILLGNTLYGTAYSGANNNGGTVFALNIDGTGFRTLHTFTLGFDGGRPSSGLTSLGARLYGVGNQGGSGGNGTVFALTSDGTDFSTLHSFSALYPSLGDYTNVGGASPYGALTVSGDHLYGTCAAGGIFGNDGTVFSISLQPQLAIGSVNGNFVLTWLTNFSAFTLQSTTNLASPVWTTNLPAPVIVNGQYTVTNPITGTQQFFRLSQ